MLPLPDIRLGLYAILLACSVILFSLTIARVSYTSHTRSERSLNSGQPFYDPSVVELLVSALLTLFFAPFMIYVTRTRRIEPTIAIELGALFVLWLLWVGGAAAAVTVWPDLSFCVSFAACRLLQALMGFAWLGWIALTMLLLIGLGLVLRGEEDGWSAPGWEVWAGRRNGEKVIDEGGERERGVAV
ncbi:hypothetical protein BDV93DRAFT_527675 [Ceratobasidium sp. AG-I]|nr:hypothetical protein BDV93DRAFT_527675 [Ceratobasidium sp. AG-I]